MELDPQFKSSPFLAVSVATNIVCFDSRAI